MNTPLDDYCIEMHYAEARMTSPLVACVVPLTHPIANGTPPSIMGLAACYDRSLTAQQGVIFFDNLDTYNRYKSQLK